MSLVGHKPPNTFKAGDFRFALRCLGKLKLAQTSQAIPPRGWSRPDRTAPEALILVAERTGRPCSRPPSRRSCLVADFEHAVTCPVHTPSGVPHFKSTTLPNRTAASAATTDLAGRLRPRGGGLSFLSLVVSRLVAISG